MSLFSVVSSWFGAIGTTNQSKGGQNTKPATAVYKNAPNVGIDGAMQVSAVWGCVDLIASTLSSLPITVYKVDSNGEKTVSTDNSLHKLFNERPNSRQTPYEFFVCFAMNYVLRGNAYARKVYNSKGEVIALWMLASDQVEVKVLDDGKVVYHYSYDGRVTVYSDDNIFHWKDKGNGIIGLSRLDYMRSSLGVAINAQNATSKMYANDNKRSGVFSIDKTLSDKQREQIRTNFKGLTETGNDDLLVLEAGAKFEGLALTPAEAQLLENRKFSIEDISRWFGVPSVMINDLSNRVPYGNNNDLVEHFYKFNIRPTVVNLEQSMRMRVMNNAQRAQYQVEFGLDALLRASLKDRMEIYAKGVQNGVYTRNEVRKLENMSVIEGGDILTAQVNLAPIDMLGNMGNTNVSGNPDKNSEIGA